jgi:hypothetical protein
MPGSDKTIVLPQRLVEDLVSNLVAQYLWRVEPDKLSNEVDAFRAMHAELLAQYCGRYVALHEGQVVDSDADRRSLYLRVRSRFGGTPVLIRQVAKTLEREFVVHSPHLEGGEL